MTARLVDDPTRVRLALSPLRRRILAELRDPASATEVAARIGETRQKVNYHLRVLEDTGLVELVELRRRRGCTERVVRAVADLVVDPALLGSASRIAERDQYAADHLVATAADTVRDVTRMRANAATRGERLLTFTLETALTFARPADVHRFTDELAAAVHEVAHRFDNRTGVRYRVVVGGHPEPARQEQS